MSVHGSQQMAAVQDKAKREASLKEEKERKAAEQAAKAAEAKRKAGEKAAEREEKRREELQRQQETSQVHTLSTSTSQYGTERMIC